MWFLMIPILLILNDYLKSPIDRLYFQRPLRPLVGIRNSLVDLFFYKLHYSVDEYTELSRVQKHFCSISSAIDVLNRKTLKYYIKR